MALNSINSVYHHHLRHPFQFDGTNLLKTSYLQSPRIFLSFKFAFYPRFCIVGGDKNCWFFFFLKFFRNFRPLGFPVRVKKKQRAMAPPIKVAGNDPELQRILSANMDEAPARRKAREAFKDIQLGIDHMLFKTPTQGVKMKESYEKNSKGVEIFMKSWLPESSRPKAMVFYCHGYGDTVTFFFEGHARKFVLSGYGVVAIDYPGFGLSEGLHGYIPSFDGLVDDVIEMYSKVKENPDFHSLPSFLFAQSLGGAVALKVCLKQPNDWSGAILVASMCKIADDMVPPPLVTKVLLGMAKIFPKHKLVPQKDLAEASFKEAKKREMTAYNVICYKDKPRLRTAMEMLKTTQEIEENLHKVSLPLLILHGEADIVTDPSVSKALYEKSSSTDKKFILYQDALHGLMEGEPDDMIERVYDDIFCWLDERSKQSSS